jgi:hypothetical protein
MRKLIAGINVSVDGKTEGSAACHSKPVQGPVEL